MCGDGEKQCGMEVGNTLQYILLYERWPNWCISAENMDIICSS